MLAPGLKDVLAGLGYSTEKQQLSIVKLMAFDGILKQKHVSNIKDQVEKIILNDASAKELIEDTHFVNIFEGMDCLVNFAKIVWLRTTNKDDKALDTSNPTLNTQTWHQPESSKYLKDRTEIITLLTDLQIIQNTAINIVVIDAALDSLARSLHARRVGYKPSMNMSFNIPKLANTIAGTITHQDGTILNVLDRTFTLQDGTILPLPSPILFQFGTATNQKPTPKHDGPFFINTGGGATGVSCISACSMRIPKFKQQ